MEQGSNRNQDRVPLNRICCVVAVVVLAMLARVRSQALKSFSATGQGEASRVRCAPLSAAPVPKVKPLQQQRDTSCEGRHGHRREA